MDKLRTSDKLIGGGGLVLFVLSFFKPWAKLDTGGLGDLFVGGASLSANAWDAFGFFPLKLGLILALVAVGMVIAKAAGTKMPEVPSIAPLIYGGAVLGLVVLAIIIGPAGSNVSFGDAGIKRGLMLFLAVIPAAAFAYGSYLEYQEAESGPSGGSAMGNMGDPSPPPPTA